MIASGVLKAAVDMAELERSLKKASSRFGDTNEQMLYRWGVSVARNVAVETQVHGGRKSKRVRSSRSASEAKKMQDDAIMGDLLNICVIIKGARRTKTGKTVRGTTMSGRRISGPASRYFDSSEKLYQFWQMNRTRRRSRTPKLPIEKKAFAPPSVFKGALKTAKGNTGLAKSGWLQAGQMIAARQKGADRIRIGKNFLGYAQKHRGHGRITVANGDKFQPAAWLHNTLPYTKDPHVLNPSKAQAQVVWAAKNLLNWYQSAIRRSLK